MTDKNVTAFEIINRRRVILGPSDKLRAQSPLKYPWTQALWKQMKDNTWDPAEISLVKDMSDYKKLSEGEELLYTRSLAFLANLDSIQVDNLASRLVNKITSPEIKQCIHRQLFEEELHVESYSRMVENTYDNPLEIYDMYRHDDVLGNKNDFITKQAELLDEGEFTPEKFLYAIDSNICLEGVFFFSGFLSFYTLARRGLMNGSSDMIKLIQRDEITHLNLFLNVRKELRKEHPELFVGENGERIRDNCIALIKGAVELETKWGCHVIEGGVLGLTDDIMKNFIEYTADLRAVAMGIGVIYGTKNPITWFDKFSQPNGSEKNFFERTGHDYKSAGALEW